MNSSGALSQDRACLDQCTTSVAWSVGQTPDQYSASSALPPASPVAPHNGGRQHYRANVADQAAWDQAYHPKTCKLLQNRALVRISTVQEW